MNCFVLNRFVPPDFRKCHNGLLTLVKPVWYSIVDKPRPAVVGDGHFLQLLWRWEAVDVVVITHQDKSGRVAAPSSRLEPALLDLGHLLQSNRDMVTVTHKTKRETELSPNLYVNSVKGKILVNVILCLGPLLFLFVYHNKKNGQYCKDWFPHK